MTELRSAVDNAVLGQLRESVGDDPEFLAELVDDFLADAPAQLESMNQAAASGDAEAARRAAHTLKGHGRTFGATELASLCQEAERASAAGDLESVQARIGAIGEEWNRVHTELRAVRDGRA